jgi:hypothetical protein
VEQRNLLVQLANAALGQLAPQSPSFADKRLANCGMLTHHAFRMWRPLRIFLDPSQSSPRADPSIVSITVKFLHI